MDAKAPAVLLVLVEAAGLRWFAASLALDGQVTPLLRSEADDLDPYRALDLDEQVSFLRHRLCGVLQRGVDRLWAQQKKACQFVFVFEGLLPEPSGELTQRVAEHFALWMLNPPVAVFTRDPASAPQADSLTPIAGSLAPPLDELLHGRLAALRAATADLDAWEVVRKKA
jgi:hypothetical protein